MSSYRFYHPIEVRYADLDPQGHVNNATYLSYLEQARVNYFLYLGLWDGNSFMDLGIILAETRIIYRAPILLGQKIRVGVRVTNIGNKSLEMAYDIVEVDSERVFAQADTVLVSYDYNQGQTIPVPESWRERIHHFEDLS